MRICLFKSKKLNIKSSDSSSCLCGVSSLCYYSCSPHHFPHISVSHCIHTNHTTCCSDISLTTDCSCGFWWEGSRVFVHCAWGSYCNISNPSTHSVSDCHVVTGNKWSNSDFILVILMWSGKSLGQRAWRVLSNMTHCIFFFFALVSSKKREREKKEADEDMTYK